MKIQVVMKSGEIRVLDLEPPLTTMDGEFMNRITDANCVDHFFLPGGCYDGWGMPLSAETAQASDVADAWGIGAGRSGTGGA